MPDPRSAGPLNPIAGYADLLREQAARRERGDAVQLGVGLSCYVEVTGGGGEFAHVAVHTDGTATVKAGTSAHGQGHATTLAQILRTRLGVPLGKIEIVEGDTDLVPYGTGTFGSRSIAVGGSALDRAAGKIIAKGKLIAAHLLEASAGDVDFTDGVFSIAGTDRRLTFAEVADAANVPHNFPLETLEPGLQETAFYDPPAFAFSNGAHVCEIEIEGIGILRNPIEDEKG